MFPLNQCLCICILSYHLWQIYIVCYDCICVVLSENLKVECYFLFTFVYMWGINFWVNIIIFNYVFCVKVDINDILCNSVLFWKFVCLCVCFCVFWVCFSAFVSMSFCMFLCRCFCLIISLWVFMNIYKVVSYKRVVCLFCVLWLWIWYLKKMYNHNLIFDFVCVYVFLFV